MDYTLDDGVSTKSSLSSIPRNSWETTSLLEGDLDGMEFPARDSFELYSNCYSSGYCLGWKRSVKKSKARVNWSRFIPKMKLFRGDGLGKISPSNGVEMSPKGKTVRFEQKSTFSKLSVKFRNAVGSRKNKQQ
jgi:hypothetical protein